MVDTKLCQSKYSGRQSRDVQQHDGGTQDDREKMTLEGFGEADGGRDLHSLCSTLSTLHSWPVSERCGSVCTLVGFVQNECLLSVVYPQQEAEGETSPSTSSVPFKKTRSVFLHRLKAVVRLEIFLVICRLKPHDFILFYFFNGTGVNVLSFNNGRGGRVFF